MSVIKLKPGQVSATIRRDGKRAPKLIKKAMRMSARRGKAILVDRTPVDRGPLKAAWKVRTLDEGGRFTGVENVNSSPYAGIVELGARPHPVSKEGQVAIYEWVRRHFGYTTSTKKGRSKMHRVAGEPFEDPVLSEITWGIIHKLKTRGQAPTYFVKGSLPVLTEAMEAEIARILREDFEKRGGVD